MTCFHYNRCYKLRLRRFVRMCCHDDWSDHMKIGHKIRPGREKRVRSHADLGRQVGVSQATIDKIEAGHTARSRYLPLIAVKLGLPLEEIDPGLAALSAAGGLTGPVIPGIELVGDRDYPIYASAEGGSGQTIVSTHRVDL